MHKIERKTSPVIAVYEHHADAARMVNVLMKHGFGVQELAIVGKGYRSEDNIIGYCPTVDGVKHWGKAGAFWCGVWGLLAGTAVFVLPGLGPIAVAGSAVTWIAGALKSSTVVPGLSPLGAGLVSVGVPPERALKYESTIKAGKYLLIAHGMSEEADSARCLLVGAQEIYVHYGKDQARACENHP